MKNTETHFGPLFKGLKKICGNDPLRPIFKGAHIIDGFIICTDAHHLVKIDLTKFFGINKELVKELNGKFIPVETLTELERITKKQYVNVNAKGFHMHHKSMLFKENGMTPPNFDQVIIDDSKIEPIEKFNIRGHYLTNIQGVYKNEIESVDSLRITTFGNDKHLKIQNKEKTFIGIIMPLNTDN